MSCFSIVVARGIGGRDSVKVCNHLLQLCRGNQHNSNAVCSITPSFKSGTLRSKLLKQATICKRVRNFCRPSLPCYRRRQTAGMRSSALSAYDLSSHQKLGNRESIIKGGVMRKSPTRYTSRGRSPRWSALRSRASSSTKGV